MGGVDQIFVFLVAATCGVVCGAIYDLFCLLRAPFPQRPVTVVSDIFFGGVCGVVWLAVAAGCKFESLRLYHLLACLLGFAVYRKSLHKIVAFFAKKLYNKIKQLRRGRKSCPEEEAKVSPTKK